MTDSSSIIKSINAVAVSAGIAFGEIYKVQSVNHEWDKSQVHDLNEQKKRFHMAKNQVLNNLDTMYGNAKEQIGNQTAKIFDFHKEIIQDDVFVQCALNIINDGYSCEYAVNKAGEWYSEVIIETGNEYLMARCCDVLDVCTHLLNELLPEDKKKKLVINKPCILAIEQLTPSIAIGLDANSILGVIEQKGSTQSHSAILMNALSIPCVCQLGEQFNQLKAKQNVILDGTNGVVITSYNEKTYNKYHKIFSRYMEKNKIQSQELVYNKQLVNRKGESIRVNANVFSLLEIDILLSLSSLYNEAQAPPSTGVGLFRSEFLYMGLSSLPSEDYQYSIYKKLLTKTSSMYNGKGCVVTIRTLDIGGDKILPYDIGMTDISLRGIEFSLSCIDVFKTQIRALYKASVNGNLSILIPMVTSVEQILQVKDIINEVKNELDNEGVQYDKNIPLGVMIETPQSAQNSDILAQNCDFFCIGTNDLTALTFQIDRFDNEKNTALDSSHPRVMELVRKAVQNAIRYKIKCSICGNSAYDTNLTLQYIEMGITDFSVPTNKILPLKQKMIQIYENELN